MGINLPGKEQNDNCFSSPLPVKPTFSVLYNPKYKHLLNLALEKLQRFVGTFDLVSKTFHFEHLENYYGSEMGYPLYRFYLSAERFITPDPCADYHSNNCYKGEKLLSPVSLKLLCQSLEERFTPFRGKRVINIDPGFIDRNHLFLTTHKERGGRVYLGRGIYLEMEYLFFAGEFKPLFWTYRDYRDERVKRFFEKVRKKYLKGLKQFFPKGLNG